MAHKLMALALTVFFLPAAGRAQAPVPAATPAEAAPGASTQGGNATLPEANSPSVLSGFMEPFPYDPQGRKDPFAQPTVAKEMEQGQFHGPVLPLQKFALDELRLIGVIWDVNKPRAMFQDREQNVHVIGPNAKIGNRNGYVAAIREGEVVVIETTEQDGKLFSHVRVVKIADEKQAAR